MPQGSRLIGWVGGDATGNIEMAYFDPQALQAAVVTIAKDAGEPFENPRMIARDLALQGIARPEGEGSDGTRRYSTVRKIGGTSKRVIAIPLRRICQPEPD